MNNNPESSPHLIIQNLMGGGAVNILTGTNRIVFIGNEWVYKVPIHSRGIEANKAEYLNYLNHPDLVAETLECD